MSSVIEAEVLGLITSALGMMRRCSGAEESMSTN
jgi:hypothetical protein